MKNLFVLMALAGLAAFQIGCGAEAPQSAPSPAPGQMGPPGGKAGGPLPADVEARKADSGKAKDDTAVSDDATPGKDKEDDKAKEE